MPSDDDAAECCHACDDVDGHPAVEVGAAQRLYPGNPLRENCAGKVGDRAPAPVRSIGGFCLLLECVRGC